ncbi:MAG: Tyrosine-protein kinase EpsD [Myxococcaceae bacterium]|nr:Tyrosine-protein kinase EpsD [Myxococcaceae bacterium]
MPPAAFSDVSVSARNMTDEQTRSLVMPTAKQTPAATISMLVAELWRYKLVVPAVAAVVVAAVVFWTMRQPKIYEAAATLEYDPHPAQPLGSKLEDQSGNSFWDSQEFYETQNFILRSRSIAERVARKLALHRDDDFMGRATRSGKAVPEANALEGATARVMKALKIEQVRDTRIVRIRAQDRSPDRAQLIANAVVDAYIEKSLEDRLGTSSRAMEWLGNQMQNLKRELESSELALYKFREGHHTLSASLEERRKIIGSQLQSYNNTLTQIRERRVQIAARLSVLRELSAAKDPLALSSGPLANDPAIAGLRVQYRETSEQLGRLSLLYGDAHPQVRAARAARDMVLSSLEAQVNSIYAGIEAELKEHERAEKGIQAALDEVNRQGLALSLQEIDYTRLERERSSKTELYGMVMERAAQTDLSHAMRVPSGRALDSAIRSDTPVSPNVRLIVTFAVVIGLTLGVFAALGVSYLDNKVRGPADMEARGVTVLGVMPSIGAVAALPSYSRDKRRGARRLESSERDMIVHLEPRSTAAECCRTIRTNITFQAADRPLRTIAVTSAMPKDGKTTVAVSLATALAQSGRRVLLIDTDMRKPRLHRVFKLPGGPGITSVLAGEATLDEVVRATDVPDMSFMQCGPLPPNPSELLHTRRFAEVIEEARSKYDTVIFDTPPLGAVTDPAIIATQVDGTVLVVRSGSTTRNGVDAALRQLSSVSARLLGIVLNGVDLTDSNYGSYYAYYRGYYEEDGKNDGSGPPGKTAPRTT